MKEASHSIPHFASENTMFLPSFQWMQQQKSISEAESSPYQTMNMLVP
jgi:hypothetical protein